MSTVRSEKQVRTIALHIFEAAGVSRARAETLANCLVEADLMGISSHGVIRIPVYVRRILEGLTEIHAEIGPIREHPATALLDGKNVIGQVAGGQAMTLAIQKAAQCGVGCVGLRGTNHFGTCGHYAAMAAKQNTIYDFLVMSLTSKDLIATFNWDPFLVQAIGRAMKYTSNIPQVAFLHGNVAVGFCVENNIMGNVGMICPKCGIPLAPTKLLFPIKKKDYNSDIAISKAWKTLNNALEKAYMVTVFGYSAPKSDAEAVAMMKKAWGSVNERNLEEIELIDIRDEEAVIESWSEFIHTHHYSYNTSFFDSTLARCPRRTCEATFDRLMNCIWLDGSKGFKDNMSFADISKFISPLVVEEENAKGKGIILSNPYQ